MTDYTEAKQWMDIRRFKNASEIDGSVWVANLWLAVNASLPKNEPYPRWFDATDLRKFKDERASELGTLVVRPGIESWKERSFKSVSALSPSDLDFYYSDVWPSFVREDVKLENVDVTPLDERIDIFDKNRAFASIDLTHADERILADFKEWLEVTREKLHRNAPLAIKPSYLERLKNHQVLPYVWLQAWQLENNKNLILEEVANILFPIYPGEREVDPLEKLKKSTRKYANQLTCIIDGKLNMNNVGFAKLRNGGDFTVGINPI